MQQAYKIQRELTRRWNLATAISQSVLGSQLAPREADYPQRSNLGSLCETLPEERGEIRRPSGQNRLELEKHDRRSKGQQEEEQQDLDLRNMILLFKTFLFITQVCRYFEAQVCSYQTISCRINMLCICVQRHFIAQLPCMPIGSTGYATMALTRHLPRSRALICLGQFNIETSNT